MAVLNHLHEVKSVGCTERRRARNDERRFMPTTKEDRNYAHATQRGTEILHTYFRYSAHVYV